MNTIEKIKAELHATAEMHEDGYYYLRDKWVDEIIDKYAEQEQTIRQSCENCKHDRKACGNDDHYGFCQNWEYADQPVNTKLMLMEANINGYAQGLKDSSNAEQEPCEDAVSRQAVCEIINDIRDCISVEGYWAILERLKKLPSVRPQEPKTGRWIGIDEEPHEDYECDKCGYVVSTFTANIEPHTEYKYCPNCGCRMVEPRESEDKE